jgi:hypothetical protein
VVEPLHDGRVRLSSIGDRLPRQAPPGGDRGPSPIRSVPGPRLELSRGLAPLSAPSQVRLPSRSTGPLLTMHWRRPAAPGARRLARRSSR